MNDNQNLSVAERAAELLKKMTLEEKAAQLHCLWMLKPMEKDFQPDFSERGAFSPEKAKAVMSNGIGQISQFRDDKDIRQLIELTNQMQKWLAENTRLRIPALVHVDGLHGYMGIGATVFPIPIALAASWDVDLVHQVFTATALEARANGGHLGLDPNLDLAREPRWGRTEETYGEDPYLASRMGVAVVRALQGGGEGEHPIIDDNHIIATGKHFAGHGQPEGGTNIAPIEFSERTMRETHLQTFEAVVKEANLQAIMPAYHEYDGIPAHADRWLLEDVLRNEWNFQGIVISDYIALSELVTRHKVAHDKTDAAKQSLEAGVDAELPDPDIYATLVEAVKNNVIAESLLDKSVLRILRAKFQLGLFENPYADVERALRVTGCEEHRQIAAEAARRSIVLLKNDGNLLPLDRTKLKSVAVIGPNAAEAHLGGYTEPKASRKISILDGIKQKLGDAVAVNYAEGCKITKEGGKWWLDTSTPSDEADDRRLIAEAVEVAKNSDAVILVVGGNEDTNKEAYSEMHLGDRDSLELVGLQNDLVKAVKETGKPVVVFLINAGPLAVNYIAENIPAILEGFYLGEETGTAAADVLFGDYNPGGKLPVSFPRNVGQLPIYYNRKPTTKRGYLYASTEPLFAFGHGLSYTTFSYADVRVAKAQIKPNEETAVTVKVTNTGDRRGDEVVQMYVRDEISSVTRPLKELKDFARITLDAGETKEVTFGITPEKLWFYNREMRRAVEPGIFQIMIGGNSVDLISQPLEVVQ